MAEVIKRLTRDISFDPRLTVTVGAAFDWACRAFEKPPSLLVKKHMADHIVARATAGERDYERLVADALKAAAVIRFRREDP